jgi:hypothetical protein
VNLVTRILTKLGILATPAEDEYLSWADARLDQLEVARRVAGEPRRDYTPRALRVRAAMVELVVSGLQPTPALVVKALGDTPHRQSGGVSLNGRDAKVFAETMMALGYVRVPRAPGSWQYRWVNPSASEGA